MELLAPGQDFLACLATFLVPLHKFLFQSNPYWRIDWMQQNMIFNKESCQAQHYQLPQTKTNIDKSVHNGHRTICFSQVLSIGCPTNLSALQQGI